MDNKVPVKIIDTEEVVETRRKRQRIVVYEDDDLEEIEIKKPSFLEDLVSFLIGWHVGG